MGLAFMRRAPTATAVRRRAIALAVPLIAVYHVGVLIHIPSQIPGMNVGVVFFPIYAVPAALAGYGIGYLVGVVISSPVTSTHAEVPPHVETGVADDGSNTRALIAASIVLRGHQPMENHARGGERWACGPLNALRSSWERRRIRPSVRRRGQSRPSRSAWELGDALLRHTGPREIIAATTSRPAESCWAAPSNNRTASARAAASNWRAAAAPAGGALASAPRDTGRPSSATVPTRAPRGASPSPGGARHVAVARSGSIIGTSGGAIFC